MPEHMSWIIPLVGIATSAGSSAYSQSRQKSAQTKARRRQRKVWLATAFPSAAERQSAMGELGQARQSSYQNLATQLASRGMGPGSGVGAKRAGGIEAGYGKAYSHLISEFQKPRWPLGGTPYYGGPGPGAAAVGAGSQALNEAMGYYWASQMYGSGGGGYQNPYIYKGTGLENQPLTGW